MVKMVRPCRCGGFFHIRPVTSFDTGIAVLGVAGVGFDDLVATCMKCYSGFIVPKTWLMTVTTMIFPAPLLTSLGL